MSSPETLEEMSGETGVATEETPPSPSAEEPVAAAEGEAMEETPLAQEPPAEPPPEPVEGKGLAFALSEDGAHLSVTHTPEEGRASVDVAWVQERIAGQGCEGWAVSEEGMAELLRRYNAAAAEAFTLEIAQKVDGRASVDVAPDSMEAWLTIIPPKGGAAVTREDVDRALREKNVTFGLLEDAIMDALAAGVADKVAVAQGQPAMDGEDGRLVSLVSGVVEHSPHMDSHGRINYRDLGGIVTVHKGQRIMQRLLATPGEAGQNVLGQVISPKPGREVMFAARLEGAQQDPEAPEFLIAAIGGQPVPVEGGMTVNPLVEIADVDLSIGNLNIDGNVHITGEVQAGMQVVATGDIEVEGTVEAALLDAGGNITLHSGIIGHKEVDEHVEDSTVGEARIRCDGSVKAKFVENAAVAAGDSIHVGDLVMQSELLAGNAVIVGEAPGKGHVIGGVVQAGKLIQAGSLGSVANVHTRLAVGVDPHLAERLKRVRHEIARRVKELDDLEKLFHFVEEHPGRLAPSKLEKARHTQEVLTDETVTLKDEEAEILAQFALAEDARIEVGKELFSNVEITFGEKVVHTMDERGPGAFVMKDGEIVYE